MIPAALTSPTAERVAVGSLLRRGRAIAERFVMYGLTRSDFMDDSNGAIWDAAMYCAMGSADGPVLVDVYIEARRWTRKGRAAFDIFPLAGPGGLQYALATYWCEEPVFRGGGWHLEVNRWSDGFGDVGRKTPYCPYLWSGAASALLLRHLTARREAYFAAQETLRESLSPTGDAEHIRRLTDRLE